MTKNIANSLLRNLRLLDIVEKVLKMPIKPIINAIAKTLIVIDF